MATSQLEAKGFFGALFDFGFTSFITLRFLKVIYAVLVGLILLAGVLFFIVAASRGGAGALLGVVLVPVVTLLYLVIARVYMEIIALFFRIGENTSVMAAAMTGGAPAAPGFSGPVAGGGSYGAPYPGTPAPGGATP
jgi:hypothetical protein